MLKGWKNESTVVDLSETAINDVPEVVEAYRRQAEAIAEDEAAKAEQKRLNSLLSPYVHQQRGADVIEVANARLAVPQVQQRLVKAEIARIEAQRTLNRVLEEARQRFTEARIPARRPLMHELFQELDRCVEAAERLAEYDLRTQQLGGSPPETPFPELTKAWNGTESKVSQQRRYLKEWLT